jgi:hypothetical protein
MDSQGDFKKHCMFIILTNWRKMRLTKSHLEFGVGLLKLSDQNWKVKPSKRKENPEMSVAILEHDRL